MTKAKLIGPIEHVWFYGKNRYYQYIRRPKHDMLLEGLLLANRFSFLVPEEMVSKIDTPDYAGLYVVRGDRIIKIRQGQMLHKRKITDELLLKIGRKMMFRYWNKRA